MRGFKVLLVVVGSVLAGSPAAGQPGQIAAPNVAAGTSQPLAQPGPLEQRAKRITLENPVPRRLFSVNPQYPAEARLMGLRASASLLITLDESGRVGEVRLLSVNEHGRGLLEALSPNARNAARVERSDLRAIEPTPDPNVESGLNAMAVAATEAVRLWQYQPPADGPLSLRMVFIFVPDSEAGLAAHEGWSPQTPADREALRLRQIKQRQTLGFTPQ